MKTKRNDELATTGAVIERVKAVMGAVYERLTTEDPALAQDLAVVAPQLEALAVALTQIEDVAAAALAAADDARMQRNLALDDLAMERRRNGASHVRELARYIAFEARIAPADAERVLEQLAGRIDLPVSDFTKETLFEAIGQFAQELYEEDLYLKAIEADEEAERGEA